jgi:hypothetical protein
MGIAGRGDNVTGRYGLRTSPIGTSLPWKPVGWSVGYLGAMAVPQWLVFEHTT